MSFFIVPLHRSWAIKTSSRQRELDAQAEILRGRRITAARQERRIGLAIIVETHGEHLAQGIISRETQLQGIVAAAGAARHRGYITDDGCLLAETEVETQVQVVIRTIVPGLILALASVSAVLLGTRSSLHLVCLWSTEEIEIVDAIAHTYHPVFAQRLVHLYTRHTEVQHSGLAILTLDSHIVVQRYIHTEQWRECLVDAHLRNIEHAARRWIARRGIRHEAQTIHILLIGTVAAITAHGKDALVGVVDVHTLEVLAEPSNLPKPL